jgi:hypothetical protein
VQGGVYLLHLHSFAFKYRCILYSLCAAVRYRFKYRYILTESGTALDSQLISQLDACLSMFVLDAVRMAFNTIKLLPYTFLACAAWRPSNAQAAAENASSHCDYQHKSSQQEQPGAAQKLLSVVHMPVRCCIASLHHCI